MVAGRDPDIGGRERGAERVHGAVEAERLWVEPERGHRGEAERTLPVLGERPGTDVVSVVRGSGGGDQRQKLLFEPVEHGPNLCCRGPGLEVVEEDVVRLVCRFEAVDQAVLELEMAVEPGSERVVVVRCARRDPGLHALGGGLRHLARQRDRDPARLLPVAAGDADQARVIGVVGKRRFELAELAQELTDSPVHEPLVRHALERGESFRPDGCAGRGHHHHLIPVQHRRRRPEIRHLSEPVLQLRESCVHDRSLFVG